MLKIKGINLAMFDGNTNLTTDAGLSDEMKTYYSDYLIDLAEPKLVHDQFGQKHPIPKNGGKIIEFRKYSPLPKLMTPLSEGVTPDGQKITMDVITATVEQYGGYVELSDILLLTAIDNNLVQATKLLGSQAGRTLDTITREELNSGTNVVYSGGVLARHQLTGGAGDATDKYLKVDDIKRAVRALKKMNADKIDGDYVGIINQDCTYDLTNDPQWQYPHQYVDTENIYSGEIGRIAGVRFVETSEAKIFTAEALLPADNTDPAVQNLTVKTTSSGTTVAVKEKITDAQATAIVGRMVIIGDAVVTVTAATAAAAGSATLTVDSAVTATANDTVYGGEAGAGGRDVYSTLILGADAYGVTEISGGGLQHIVKQLGSSGTADPLNQRGTAGWKATKVAKILVEEYMVRIESCSTFNDNEGN